MKKTNKIISITIALLFLLVLSNKTYAQTRHIEAIILDSLTRQPMQNVNVVINYMMDNKTVKLTDGITNEKGEVSFPSLLQDLTYQLVVQLPKYKQKRAYGTFGASKGDFFIKLKLYMSGLN